MLRMIERIVVGVVSFKPEDGAVFHIGFESTFAAAMRPAHYWLPLRFNFFQLSCLCHSDVVFGAP